VIPNRKKEKPSVEVYDILKGKSLNQINLFGIGFILIFIVLFSSLIVYEEYQSFDQEVAQIKAQFLEDKKALMRHDMERISLYLQKYASSQKEEVIEMVHLLHNIQKEDGFFFIVDKKGKRFDQDDIASALIKRVLTLYEGYIEPTLLKWNDPKKVMEVNHLVYLKTMQPFEWKVGMVVNLDEMQRLIDAKATFLRSKLIEVILKELTLALILFGVILAISKIISSVMQKETKHFLDFFDQAANNFVVINKELLHFKEFRAMSNYANQMVETINERTRELELLNMTLEDKVKAKTQDLADKNSALEKANTVNEELLKNQEKFLKHSIHEVNTPLSIILTHLDLFKMEYGENRYVQKIESATKMIHTIFSDLSTTLKKSHRKFRLERIDFSQLLEERIAFYDSSANRNDLTLKTVITPELKVTFNHTSLQRLIDNNISNARKYAKRNSSVTITLEMVNEQTVFSVTTYSEKIEDTTKIFEQYYREDSVKGGFGLGLSMVKEICDEAGVMIRVTSTDKLTTFTYTFGEKL
jgi:signal transduction histidine kinase